MSRRPTITLVDNPVSVGGSNMSADAEPEPAPVPQRTAQPRRATPPEPAETPPIPQNPDTNPYARMRKVQAPVRLFPPLWDHLEMIVRDLRDDGLDVDKTALLNAVLHFCAPADSEEARELVNRWRALLARPPARRP